MSALLEIRDLRKHFGSKRAPIRAVDGVSLEIEEGESVGLVGESGCGKTTLGRSLLRIIEPTSGTIRFAGKEITGLSNRDMRAYRKNMQIVFQDPFSSLNPRMRIADILMEPMQIFGTEGSFAERERRVEELLDTVGLDKSAGQRFPHEFSGGQRQRVGIARALALRPRLIVCDEPVSALDVSIQAQIINLLRDLQASEKLTYLFVSHDLNVVRHMCSRIAVMYLGRLVEVADTETLFATPRHPYTEALLSAIPGTKSAGNQRILLSGDLPSPANPPEGCHFHPRCPKKLEGDICEKTAPKLQSMADHSRVACHLAEFSGRQTS